MAYMKVFKYLSRVACHGGNVYQRCSCTCSAAALKLMISRYPDCLSSCSNNFKIFLISAAIGAGSLSSPFLFLLFACSFFFGIKCHDSSNQLLCQFSLSGLFGNLYTGIYVNPLLYSFQVALVGFLIHLLLYILAQFHLQLCLFFFNNFVWFLTKLDSMHHVTYA